MARHPASEKLRSLAAVIRKHGTCAPMALEMVADELDAQPAGDAVRPKVESVRNEIASTTKLLPPEWHDWACEQVAALNSALAAPVQPVVDEALIRESANHLTHWLDMDQCECESGHHCGRTEVTHTRDRLLAALTAQPGEGVGGG